MKQIEQKIIQLVLDKEKELGMDIFNKDLVEGCILHWVDCGFFQIIDICGDEGEIDFVKLSQKRFNDKEATHFLQSNEELINKYEIIGHYNSMDWVLRYILKSTNTYDNIDYTPETIHIGLNSKGDYASYVLPLKPLNTYTEQQLKDLYDLLTKLG